MNTRIITFKYEGQPANKPGVKYSNLDLLSEVIELLKTGGVAMTGWENTEHFTYDSSINFHNTITEDHTIIEIRLDINETPEPDEHIDWHDGGQDVFSYVIDALELEDVEIRYFYSIGDEPMQKSVLGIDINPHK